MRDSWRTRIARDREILFYPRLVMAKIFDVICWTILFLTTVSAAAAQGANQPSEEKCDGVVYEAKEVSQKAKITSKPPPTYPAQAAMHNVSGRVALTAVLCRSGRVTDIQVTKGLPFGLTESAAAAVKKIKFDPAQKDGQPVSQAIELEYSFSLNPHGHRPLAKEPVEGRIVESRIIMGMACRYRQEVWRQIWAQIKTSVGNPYHQEQGHHDMDAVLALGYFDKKQSYLRLEEGEKGGIDVVFFLKELPQQDLCDK
jgi:TonB family protein